MRSMLAQFIALMCVTVPGSQVYPSWLWVHLFTVGLVTIVAAGWVLPVARAQVARENARLGTMGDDAS